MSELRPIDEAPKDGTEIFAYYEANDPDPSLIYWEEDRYCMLGRRAGSFPPGWACYENGHLPVDEPSHWKPNDNE